jgi:hypothetical protein
MGATKARTTACVAVFVGLTGPAACAGSKTVPSAQSDAEAVCPATPAETIGVACAVAGLRCGPQYTCGIDQATVLCVCTGGAFRCTDGAGNQLDKGAVPMCPAPTRGGSCPSTERGAQLSTCSEQGLLCPYPSACPSRFDQCQCFPGATIDGGFGLRFECTPATCGGFDAGAIVRDSGNPADAIADSPHVFDSGGDSEAASSADSGSDSEAASGTDSGGDESIGNDAPAGDAPFE